MESNSKIYEEDQKKELQNEKIDEEDSKMKIESLLPKGEKEKDKQDNNQDNSSFDEEFYSDVSSDNNTNENSSNLKKTKTLNDKINDKNYLNEKYKKDLRRSNYIENKLMSSITKKENANRKNLELAKSINFKSIPDKIIETDEFGFLKKVERPGEESYIPGNEIKSDEKKGNDNQEKNDKKTKEYLLLINSRTEKWIYMLEHYDNFTTKKFSKLKQRTRKGIPDSLRSNVWQLFADIKKFYKKDIFEKLSGEKLDEETEETIIKDLDRTYPSCQLFTDKYGNGQRKLYKVLSCFSIYNKEVGYVQGMGFLVAVFLIYMDEESSFFMLDSIMNKYEMKGIYLPGFPDLKKKFYVLLNLEKKYIPKIYDVFKRDNILPSLYASEWFICLFAKDLHFNAVVRIFDVFLLEGFKVIFRFALAFLKIKEKNFLKSTGMMDTLDILHETLNNIDIEDLFSISFGFHLSKNLIKKFENEYDKNINNENDEFISQL
jgi:hypothetical protein